MAWSICMDWYILMKTNRILSSGGFPETNFSGERSFPNDSAVRPTVAIGLQITVELMYNRMSLSRM